MAIPKPSGSSEFWVKKDLIGKTGVIIIAPETRNISVGKKAEDQTGFDVQVGQETRWFNPSNACYQILYDMLKASGVDVEQEASWVNRQIVFSENMAKITVKGGSTKLQEILLAIPVGMTYQPPTPIQAPTQAPPPPYSRDTQNAGPPPADRSAEVYQDALALQTAGVEPDLQKAIALVKKQKGIP